MRTLLNKFLSGCLVLFPVIGTVYAVWFVLGTIDRLVGGLFGDPAPGVGLLVAVGVIVVTGTVATNVVGRAVVRRLEKLVDRVPLIGLLHSAIRDVVGAFVGERRSFDRPVVVRLSGEVRVFGFLTREALDDPRLAGMVAVYLPQSYNFAGNLIVVPRANVEPLPVAGPDFLAFVVSGGVHDLDGRSETA
jgi:uncharacterized membrane protein